MKTYVSTGGIKDKTCIETAKILYEEMGVSCIELSGGIYDPDFERNLIRLKNSGCEITLHNYIPFKRDSYVINLASNNEKVIKQTVCHVKKALEYSSLIGAKYYAIHAGYLIDPAPEELGRTLNKKIILDRGLALKAFKTRVSELSSYAKKLNVRLLIENNVISNENYEIFNENPLLLCEVEEIEAFFKDLNSSVGLLLDVAHLKVSSNSLGFDLNKSIQNLNKYVEGYHISDNNGFSDENQKIDKDAWFLGFLKRLPYNVLEVYDYKEEVIKDQLELLKNNEN